MLQSGMALVTGGAVRIGRAICIALADRGCGVVIHYNKSEREAMELCAMLEDEGKRAFTVRGDLRGKGACRAVLLQAREKAGNINILVNNASVFRKDSLLSATEANVSELWDINTLAPMMLTALFAAAVESDATEPGGCVRGGVINLLDQRIAGNETGCLPYLLSKKMLAALTRNAARELAPLISVNAVAPGAVLPPPGSEQNRVREAAGQALLEYQCTPEDVAAAVVYLLESEGITGQTLFVDSGQHLV